MEFRSRLAAAFAWALLTLYAYLGATRRLMRADLVLLAWARLFLHQKALKTAIKFYRAAAKIRRKEHPLKLSLLKFRSRASSATRLFKFLILYCHLALVKNARRMHQYVRVARVIFKFYLLPSFADKILSFAANKISPSRRANFIFVDG